MSRGDLPNLARVFESGAAVEMDSALPDVSAVAWTSANTGMNPAKHGIYGFVDRKAGTNAMEIMTSSHVRAKTLWELASEAGRRSVAVNVPLSFPPQHVNGIVISDFLAPTLSKAVYPDSLIPTLQGMGYRIDIDPRTAQESLDVFLEDFRVTAEKRAEAVMHLMDTEEWGFFMVVFMETDRLHHFMWQYMEDDDPVYGPKFVDAYRQIDRLAGRILEKVSDDDELIILSDHGFTSLRQEVYLNIWLEEAGLLRFDGASAKGLQTMGPRSRAFSLDPGRIYVNLEGREAAGTVSRDQYEETLQEIIAGLTSLRDDETGAQLVKRIYRADEIYRGPFRDRAPDLLVMPHDGFDFKGTFEATSVRGKSNLLGMHKYDNATLFIRNRSIGVDHASIHDVLPTACTLLQMPCPPEVDGQVVIQG